jgi:hypothetical protein
MTKNIDWKPWQPPSHDIPGAHQILGSDTPIEDLKERMREVLFEESDNPLMEGMHQIILRKVSEYRDLMLERVAYNYKALSDLPDAELWADPQNWGELPVYGELFDQLFDAIILKYLTATRPAQEDYWS